MTIDIENLIKYYIIFKEKLMKMDLVKLNLVNLKLYLKLPMDRNELIK